MRSSISPRFPRPLRAGPHSSAATPSGQGPFETPLAQPHLPAAPGRGALMQLCGFPRFSAARRRVGRTAAGGGCELGEARRKEPRGEDTRNPKARLLLTGCSHSSPKGARM